MHDPIDSIAAIGAPFLGNDDICCAGARKQQISASGPMIQQIECKVNVSLSWPDKPTATSHIVTRQQAPWAMAR
jgi:hypothetical protein